MQAAATKCNKTQRESRKSLALLRHFAGPARVNRRRGPMQAAATKCNKMQRESRKSLALLRRFAGPARANRRRSQCNPLQRNVTKCNVNRGNLWPYCVVSPAGPGQPPPQSMQPAATRCNVNSRKSRACCTVPETSSEKRTRTSTPRRVAGSPRSPCRRVALTARRMQHKCRRHRLPRGSRIFRPDNPHIARRWGYSRPQNVNQKIARLGTRAGFERPTVAIPMQQ